MSLFEILLIVSNCLTIIAIIAGPVMAAQLTREWLAKKDAQEKEAAVRKEKRERRAWIFETLMATRGAFLSAEHVRALNMIDLTFDGKESTDNDVVNMWKNYIDILNSPPQRTPDLSVAEQIAEDKRENERILDAFTDLLDVMSKSLGYQFDKVHIKKNGYYPSAHSNAEDNWRMVLLGMRQVMENNRAIPICLADHLAKGDAKNKNPPGDARNTR